MNDKSQEENVDQTTELTQEQLKQMSEMPKITGRMKRNYHHHSGAFKLAENLGFLNPEVIDFRAIRRSEGLEMQQKNIEEQKTRLEEELQARKIRIIESMQEKDYYTDEQIQIYVNNWESDQRKSYWHS